MRNLYGMTKGQQAIRKLAKAMLDCTGNLPPLPGIYLDYPAPIVRNTHGRSRTDHGPLRYAGTASLLGDQDGGASIGKAAF